MEEAEALCSQVAIIDHGSIVVKGSPDELKAGLPGNDIVVLTMDGDAERMREAALKEPYVHKANIEDGELRCYVDNGGEDAPSLMKLAGETGVKVRSVAIQKLSLEDVFIHHTGRSIREEETKKVSMFIGAGVPRKLGG